MKRFIRYFLQGLIYIAPMAVTIYVIVVSFQWIDGLLRDLPFLQTWIDVLLKHIPSIQEGEFSKYSFPGIGVLVILVGVTAVGYLGPRIITAPLLSLFEKLLDRAPLIKLIYSSVKDLLSAFVGKERKFDQPVLVKLDKSNAVERLGFITSSNLGEIGIQDKIAVYMPSSYGMLGELVIVAKEQVTPIDANSTDVMKFIVSGGVSRLQ